MSFMIYHSFDIYFKYVGRSSRTGTFNFTGIKRDANVAVLHAVVSGKCVLLLTGGAHVAASPETVNQDGRQQC
jgi:hydrogenase maturation factor